MPTPPRKPYYLSPAVRYRLHQRIDYYGLSEEECHFWTGPADPSTGYGQVNWVDVGGKQRVHVLVWETENGQEVPRDPETGRKFDVDHICHNKDTDCPGGKKCRHRLCCNWRHLEIKTSRANKDAADEPRARGRFRTHFDCGCEITPENTYLIKRKGTRQGRPRLPERRCRKHERMKQQAAKNAELQHELDDQSADDDHMPWPGLPQLPCPDGPSPLT
jgi:HNH endonuclease